MKTATITIHPAADGPPLRTCEYRGHTYVGGQPGQRYEVHVTNNTGFRILAVVTVDGINVTDGSPGSYDGPGMVISGRTTTPFKGWRTSLDAEAAFYIVTATASYAAGMGTPANIGVIGLAVFQEKRRAFEVMRGPVARPAVITTRGGQTRSMGTGFGEAIASPARTTTFDRNTTTPVVVYEVRYDSTEALVAAGIMPSEGGPNPNPNPFPGNPSQTFCPRP